jgi:TolB-like protein/class 3 adenylate cyclase
MRIKVAPSRSQPKERRSTTAGSRRLVAILIADVAGYSALMHADEEGTFARFNAAMAKVVRPAIRRHRGRLVKGTGDGFLAEFGSTSDAVRCAISFQERLSVLAAAEPTEKRLLFRVGITLGDVMAEDGDIHGDGVNIAARLQTLATPGGIVVSGAVRDSTRGRFGSLFEDLGDQQVKGIRTPIRAFRLTPVSADKRPEWNPSLSLPDRPSIAILPFQNLSGDTSQDYFADGIVTDIITALSQVRSFFVIARSSTFNYRERPADAKQIARELGVQYVLEGTVRKSGERVRVSGELIDAISGVHVWADRFEGTLADVFALQDQVTASVVAAIEPRLLFAEVDRVRRNPPNNVQVYDLFLRATGHFYAMTREDIEAALALVTRSIELDPGYARSYALAGRCYLHRKVRGWVAPTDPSIAEGVRLARIAVDKGGDNPEVLWMAAIAIGLAGGDIEGGVALIDRSLALNPNSAEALTYSGMLHAYLGDSETALEYLARSNRLSPVDVQTYNKYTAAAFAHFMADRYEAALEWSDRALAHKLDYQPPLRMRAACLGLLDRTAEGRQAIARLLAVSPSETLASVRAYYQDAFKKPGSCERLLEGLRRSGLAAGA